MALNILWFSGLICSLSATTFGVIVKQWLYDYNSTNWEKRTTDEFYARWILYRSEGISDWHVQSIIASLFYLLQLSLVLFFSGLVVLLWTMRTVVASVVTALVFVVFALMSATFLLPTFHANCYFASPLAHLCYSFIQRAKYAGRLILIIFAPAVPHPEPPLTWDERERQLIQSITPDLNTKLVISTILGSATTVSSSGLDEPTSIPKGDTILHLMAGLDEQRVYTCFKAVHNATWSFGKYGGSNVPMDFWHAALLNMLLLRRDFLGERERNAEVEENIVFALRDIYYCARHAPSNWSPSENLLQALSYSAHQLSGQAQMVSVRVLFRMIAIRIHNQPPGRAKFDPSLIVQTGTLKVS